MKQLFCRAGCSSESGVRQQVAAELGSITSVVKLYLQELAGEHQADVATALGWDPFDTEHWQSQLADDRLPRPQRTACAGWLVPLPCHAILHQFNSWATVLRSEVLQQPFAGIVGLEALCLQVFPCVGRGANPSALTLCKLFTPFHRIHFTGFLKAHGIAPRIKTLAACATATRSCNPKPPTHLTPVVIIIIICVTIIIIFGSSSVARIMCVIS